MKKRIYIFNNTILKRKQNTLFFEQVMDKTDDAESISDHLAEEYLLGSSKLPIAKTGKYIPVENVDSIFAIGTVNLNTHFLYFLNKYKIPLHTFSTRGNYAGSFIPAEKNISGNTLVKQVEFYNNNKKRLYLAKQFVTAAAHNTLCNLKYHQNRKANIGDYIEYIEEIVKELDEVEDVDELMGYEGMIKRAYYEAWKEIFNYPIDFYKRVKNPPDNLINSLISYGNMIVYGVCINEIYQTKLYPEISFLHEPSEARLSLCFDIAEMFKPLLTDRIIFKVINKNMISPKDAFTKNGFCRLSKNAKKIYAQEFELKLNTKIKLKDKSNKLTYKTLIREECYKLHKHITEKEKYIAYKSKW